jgi:hypothetical protein
MQDNLMVIHNLKITGAAHAAAVEAAKHGAEVPTTIRQMLEIGGSVLQHGSSRATVDTVSNQIEHLLERLKGMADNEYGQVLSKHKDSMSQLLSEFMDPNRQTSVQFQIQELMKNQGISQQQAVTSLKAQVETITGEMEKFTERMKLLAKNDYGQILTQHKEQLANLLAEFMDPNRQSSVQFQVQELMKSQGMSHHEAISKLLGDENGVLGNLKKHLDTKLTTLDNKQAELLKDVATLTERLRGNEELLDSYGRGTSKGFDHESRILEALEVFSQYLRDQVSDVGKELGLQGTKKGDCVVKINEEETEGLQISYLIEAKDQKLSLNAALKELDLGMKNRGTQAGVLVFANQDQMPTNGLPFRLYSGNRILVCLQEGGERISFEVACQLARSLALHAGKKSSDSVDITQIEEPLEKLGRILDDAKCIEKGTSAARKGLDQVETGYKNLKSDAVMALTEIRSILFS